MKTAKNLSLKRLIVVFVLVMVMAMPMFTFAYDNGGRLLASDQDMYNSLQLEGLYTRVLTHREEGIDIRGIIPVIPSHFIGHEHLNASIEEAVRQITHEARRVRARAVRFNHEVHQSEGIASIVIYANISSSINRTLVRSVNFNKFSGHIITANEASGVDIVSLARLVISERVRRDPARYYAAMSIDLDDQSFIMTPEGVVFLFDEFQLSTIQSGITSIFLNNENIRTAVVYSGQYHMLQDSYSLQMIPLRFILEQQPGYRVEYFAGDQGIEVQVWRDGQLVIKLRPGFNEYELHGMHIRSLEGTPQMLNGVVYVPITFFNQIFPLTTYSIDLMGTIAFLSYLG